MALKRGDFSRVDKSVCVIVLADDERDVPEGHVAVWYGESNAAGLPRIRTVPSELVTPLPEAPEIYH